MKIIRGLIHIMRNRAARSVSGEGYRCSETSCQYVMKKRSKISPDIPARDRCFNISNCRL